MGWGGPQWWTQKDPPDGWFSIWEPDGVEGRPWGHAPRLKEIACGNARATPQDFLLRKDADIRAGA